MLAAGTAGYFAPHPAAPARTVTVTRVVTHYKTITRTRPVQSPALLRCAAMLESVYVTFAQFEDDQEYPSASAGFNPDLGLCRRWPQVTSAPALVMPSSASPSAATPADGASCTSDGYPGIWVNGGTTCDIDGPLPPR